MSNISFAFWGSDEFSIGVLNELIKADMIPKIIVSVPDQPKGRKKIVTPTPLKTFALENDIPCLTPEKLDIDFEIEYQAQKLDTTVVASYGKIIPANILEIPKHKTLNVHPSLLPKWRGASPLQHTIMYDDVAGVTIMLMDSKMDHGPIVEQREILLKNPDTDPILYEELRDISAKIGGKMLVEILPKWIKGINEIIPQDHSHATFTKILEKKDGFIDLGDNPVKNLRKIRAFNSWPGTFFIHKMEEKEIRVKVLAAHIENNKLIIEKVIPEGKKQMDWKSFQRGYIENQK